MILILWIVGMLMSFAMTACLYRKIDLGKMLIVGGSIYFCVYTIISGLLMWINHFNIVRTQLLLIFAMLAVSVFVFVKDGKYLPYIRLNIKKYIPLAIVLIAGAFLSGKQQAGYYNTDQDEGLYQIRAMYYIGDYYDNYIDFNEFYNIEDASERQIYINKISEMRGFYRLSDTGEASESSVIGVTHGIATFPALLALWGKMFGLTNMNGILTLLFLLIIGNVFLICENLKHKIFTRTVAAIVMCVSPVVMWNSKNVLTEIVIGMFVTLFFELITENAKKNLGLLSSVAVFAMAFLHVTITVYMPIIVFAYFISYVYTKNKSYAWGLIASLLGYAMGLEMMLTRFRYYSLNNLHYLFEFTKRFVNENTMEMIVWCVVIIIMIVMLVLMYTPLSKKLCKTIKRFRNSRKGCRIAGIIIVIITIAELGFFIYKTIKAVNQGVWGMKMAVLCFIFNTSFIMVPGALLGIVLLRKKIIRDRKLLILNVTLLYTVFVYCGLMWLIINSYYYYARYYTPFIFLAVVCGSTLLDYFSYRIVAPVMAVCIGITISQTTLLYSAQDNTYCSYSNVESYASCIGENDMVVILDQDMAFANVFALPINALTGADIYFAVPSNIDRVIASHKDAYDDVFVAMYDTERFNEEDGIYRYVFKSKMKTSVYDNYVDKGMPYAKEAIQFESPIALLLYQGE